MNGLVVEGGASRTYFAVGVIDAMMEEDIPFDYLGGASAGISNAMNYATGQIGRGIEIGTTQLPKKEYSGLRHLFNPKNRSLYNIDYVFRRVPDELVPYDYGNGESGIYKNRKTRKRMECSCGKLLASAYVSCGSDKRQKIYGWRYCRFCSFQACDRCGM